MKRIILVLVAIIMCFSLMSCGGFNNTNTFIPLKDNEVLNVGGNSVQYMNYQDEREEVQTLTYNIEVTYNLLRSSYSSSDYIYYNGYYYYWSMTTKSESEELGKKTTKYTYTYSYLPYGEDENVVVKSKVYAQTTYDYKGGWVERETKVTINLNGYFSTFDVLNEKCPELAKKVDKNTVRQYYIDVITPDSVNTTTEKYTTFYYIEEK